MNQFQSWYRMQPPALRAILTINVAFYVLWVLVLGRLAPTAAFVQQHIALNPAFPDVLFQPWQLLTYNFIHLGLNLWGLLHLVFNMLWLVWIGREFEELHGAHRFTAVYLLTGLGGGLLSVLAYALFPTSYTVFIHGASASVLGVITAVAVMYPYKSIALLFIGTVRLIYVVIGFLVLDLLFLSQGGTAVWAHMGGALFGFLFVKAEARGMDLSSWARVFFGARGGGRSRAKGRPMGGSSGGGLGGWLEKRQGKKKGEPENVHPIRSAPSRATPPEPQRHETEVDRILDKISEKGYNALSEEEKRILYEASRK